MTTLVFRHDLEDSWVLYKRFTDYDSAVQGVADAPDQETCYMLYEQRPLVNRTIYRAAASQQMFEAFNFVKVINGSKYLKIGYSHPFEWCLEAKGMPFLFTTTLT
jgi:hypothetical protein